MAEKGSYATAPPYGTPPPGGPQYPPQQYDRAPGQQYQQGPPPVQNYPPQNYPPPAAGVPVTSTVVAATRVPYVDGVSPPAPPPGFAYVLKEDCSVLAIILAIIFFPWGLLFLLCLRERYWLLVPAS